MARDAAQRASIVEASVARAVRETALQAKMRQDAENRERAAAAKIERERLAAARGADAVASGAERVPSTRVEE